MKNAILILRISGLIYIVLGVGIGLAFSPAAYLLALVALLPFWLAGKIEKGSKKAVGAACMLFAVYVFSIFLPLGIWGLWSIWKDPGESSEVV